MADDIARLGFLVDTRGLLSGEKELNKYAATGEHSERRMNAAVSNMNRDFMSLKSSIGLVSVALAGIASGRVASEIVAYSDTWKGLSSQIRQVTESESELSDVRGKLIQITKDTRSELDTTVRLYSEIKRSTDDLNISTERQMGVTKTLNNLFMAGGKPISEVSGAIRQLTQGFAAGALRGDEFNSVAEGAPRIMDALGKKLNMTRGELREFAATGGITADILVQALEDYSKTAQQMADKTEKTFAQNMQASSNNAIEFVGNSKTINESVALIGSSIEDLSENLDSLADASVAMISVFGVGLTAALAKSTSASIAKTIATIAESKASLSAAQMANAQSLAELKLAKSEQTALVSSLALAQSERTRTAIRLQLAESTGLLTVANSAYAKSQATVAAATVSASIATTGLGVATRFLLGPWGLLITAIGVAASVFIDSKESSDELKSSLERQSAAVTQLTLDYKGNTAAQLQNTNLKASQSMNILLVERARLEKEIRKVGSNPWAESSIKLNADLMAVNQTIDKLGAKSTASGNMLRDMFESGMDSIEWTNGQESANKSIAETAEAAKAAEEEFAKFSKEVSEFQTPLQSLVSKLEQAKSAIASGLIPASSNATAYIKNLEDSISALSEKLGDTTFKDYSDTISSLQELSLQQKLTADEYEIHAARMKAEDQDLSDKQIAEIENRIRAVQKERDAISQATDYSAWLMSLNETVGQASALEQKIVEIQKAMDSNDLNKGVGEKNIKLLKKQMEDLKEVAANPFDQMIAGANDAASAMSGMFESGSKEAQKMAVAMAALNLIAGVGAILTQGKGDPYTAFGRMAAMAAMVASLGVAVGGLGGSFDDTSKANQESQGLNVWGEKSESIANAIEITANATDKLVGINTDMLKALQTLQTGLSAAAGVSSRGINGAEFNFDAGIVENVYKQIGLDFTSKIPLLGGFLDTLNFIPNMLGKLLGGSSKVTDSGIQILGGALSDMITGASVSAYQEVQSKRYAWSSKKTSVELFGLDEASTQFSLVFGSLADTVFSAGKTLGMNTTELENSINNFNIATTKISLKDLSIEDKQKEIEAVFSTIFDNLANAVIPFASKFQQTGEGIGETLTRIATEVSIAEFAIKNLGVELGSKLANPEFFVGIADNLATLTGGIESFADKVSSFVDDFAPESVRFTMYSDALRDSLASVGLSVPDSTEAFYALMTTLDGTTEEGQRQIAALLNAQSAANGYYDLLEDRQSEINSFNDSLKSLSSTLRSAVVSIYGTSTQASNIALDSALAAARLGDFSKALGLNLSNINPQEANFSTLESFNIEQAKTANKLAALADLTAQTATVEDMTLTAAQEQVTLLSSINETLSTGYTPTVSTSSSNSDLVIELQALRAELVDIKAATSVTAKKATSSDDTLNIIRRGGLDVRVAS